MSTPSRIMRRVLSFLPGVTPLDGTVPLPQTAANEDPPPIKYTDEHPTFQRLGQQIMDDHADPSRPGTKAHGLLLGILKRHGGKYPTDMVGRARFEAELGEALRRSIKRDRKAAGLIGKYIGH